MEIVHLGFSSFKIKGKKATVVTDPFDPEYLGLKFPNLESDIVTVSHDHKGHNFIQAIDGNPMVIKGSGEYEVKGVKIVGIRTYHDGQKGQERGKNVIYGITVDGMTIVHCGDLGHKLGEKDVEFLGVVHILMVPVGGNTTYSFQTAAEIVSQLEPLIIIPMHYKSEGINENLNCNLAEVKDFLKEIGKENILTQPKLVITKEKLPIEPIVVLLD